MIRLGGVNTLVRQNVNAAIDIVLPPQSLLTREPGSARTGIESELWSQVRFLDDPCCQICGYPFDFDMGKEALCGRCIAKPPAFDGLRAAFQYDDHSRRLVLDFKHGGRTAGLSMFAEQMKRVGRDILVSADYLVPVPLHYRRRVKRRFNQSALLARALSRRCTAHFDPDILLRVRATDSQGGKTAAGRRRNVQGAFQVRVHTKPRLLGKHVVLIDDVYTTGATLESCARTLKRAGVKRVDALTLARVVRGAQIPT